MIIKFLGSGPSKNVKRETESRTNSSILVNGILIDVTPNFLEQIKREKLTQDNIQAVLLTHAHMDAIGGLHDLDHWSEKKLIVNAPQVVLSNKRLIMDWKNLEFRPISPNEKIEINDLEVTPFKVTHAEAFPTGKDFPAFGYKIDNLVYAEDMESIPNDSEKYFKGAEVIIADAAMYFGHSIRGHMSIDKSLEIAKEFNPKKFILMQAGHTYPNQKEAENEIEKYVSDQNIESKVILAYDGLKLELENNLSLFDEGEAEDLFELQAFGSSGGKTRIAKQLISMIPDHKTYLEPYAGGAAVFWKKERAELSVLNDKNSEIAFAYSFIRDVTEDQVNKLKQMDWTPTKSTFFRLRDSIPPKDPVQRFYRFYYVHAYSYGLSSKTYGYKTVKVGILNRIMKLKENLKNTLIYHGDAIDVLEKYNSKDSFAYLDPPYPDEWAGPEGTKHFSKEDTWRLHETLKQFKGKFLLSINNLPWIREMFSDFHLSTIKVPRSFRKGDAPKFELLISNYEIRKENSEELKDFELTEGVTTSGVSAGSPVASSGLQPVKIEAPKNKVEGEIDISEEKVNKPKEEKVNLEEIKELYVVKRDGKWCVVHGHPMKPGSKTDKPEGSIIKSFPGTPEGKRRADAMHKAIIISKIKRGEMSEQVIEDAEKIESLLDQFKPITLINNFVSLVGSTVKREEDHKPNDIDIHLRMGKEIHDYLERSIKVRLYKMLDESISDKLHIFSGDAEGSHDAFAPIYHLALIPADREIVEMEAKKKVNLEPYFPQKPAGSAIYELDKILEILKEDKEYSVEYKFNGFHAVILKEDNSVKIYSEQKKDLTKAFPTLVESIKKLSNESFAVDGELVPYDSKGNILGRNELMKYTGSVESGKSPDDSNIKLHVWDITYLDEDLKKLSLKERLEYLDNLKFSERITKTPRKLAKGKSELKMAIGWASEIKGSEGAVIKEFDSVYSFGENASWKKYRKLSSLNVIVLKKVPKERGLFNYLVGIPADKKYLDPKYIENNYLVLGHTFNTKQEFAEGDKIQILIEEVWRHEEKGGVHYSIHKPRVSDKTNEKLSGIDRLEDLVTSIGVAIKHSFIDDIEVLISDELKERSEPTAGEKTIEVENFPNRLQDSLRKMIGKWGEYVIQIHTRGESVHYDLRLKVDNILEGITLFGRSIKDRLKIETERNNIRSTLKLPEPVEWLTFEGSTKPGHIGATTNYPGIFIILSKGKYTINQLDDHLVHLEFKSDSGKVDKRILEWAKENKYPYPINLSDDLIDFSGKFSWHIAHISDHYIILFDELKG